MNNQYQEPRNPETIKKELRDLELTNLSSKEWLISHPNDNLISLLLEQYGMRKELLFKELEESCRYYRRHQFTYAIKTEDNVEVSDLSYLITSFKNAVAATLNSVFSEDKSIPLYFDDVIQGSFGVLLSTAWDAELIDTKFEITFNKFFDIIDSLQNIQEIDNKRILESFSGNKVLLRKYRTFYRSIAASAHSINLEWRSFNIGNKREFFIDYKSATAIYSTLSNWEHLKPEVIKVTGSIQGVSLIGQTLQFVPYKKEGAMVKIYFNDDFKESLKHLLGETATITYQVSEQYDSENDVIISRKTLISILDNPKS
jgi:hypothetical protein